MLNINYKHYQARLNTLGFSIKVLLRFSGNLIRTNTNQQIKFFWYLLGSPPGFIQFMGYR